MAGKVKTSNNLPKGMERLKGEHLKVVQDCKSQIAHWTKVENDYRSLQERLRTLPDTLSYDVMVPFGPLAFMPGKLVHTNELTVLLGDNWFAKCSAKQAQMLVEHRKKHVENKLGDLQEVVKNLQNRAGFTEAVEKMTDCCGAFVDIREDVESEEAATKGKHRVANKPNCKPKEKFKVHLEEERMEEELESNKRILSEEELWARLDELERLEEEQDKKDRTDNNGEETTFSSSEDEKEEGAGAVQVNGPELFGPEYEEKMEEFEKKDEEEMEEFEKKDEEEMEEYEKKDEEEMEEYEKKDEEEMEEYEKKDEEEEGRDGLPTIYFSHTVELKKVRINTGKNTTLKFSERKEQKEQAKRKKKNGKSNGHEHHKILTPSDIYRVFVDVVNGEPVPRKSILKSRSRENSVCSESSESSATDFEERRVVLGRSLSHDEAAHSDTSDGITEEDSPTGTSFHPNGRFQAFSGMVVEKDPLPSLIPHLTISPPTLPTIPERKQEESVFEVPQEPPRRLSKFKAARQQK